MDAKIESIERELLRTRLSEWVQEARNNRLLNGTSKRYGTLIGLASQSVDQMPEEMENHLVDLFFVKEDETGLQPAAMDLEQVEQSLQPYAKLLWRWSASKTAIRLPSSEDALLANEIMTLLPPQADLAVLQNALEAAALQPAKADTVDFAASLARALAALKPFSERNDSTACLLMIACLNANGYTFALAENEYEALLGMVKEETLFGWLRERVMEIASRDITFSDSLKKAASLHREPLALADANRRSILNQNSLPALRSAATLQPMPGISSSLRYLSLQDMIWLNAECVGNPQPYSYDALEECSFYQYSYKQSLDVPRQAARFLMGFLKYKPFRSGNLKTALIGVIAFLEINGYEVELPPAKAAQWLLSVKQRKIRPLSAIQQVSHRAAPGSLPRPLRELAHHLIHEYHQALEEIED